MSKYTPGPWLASKATFGRKTWDAFNSGSSALTIVKKVNPEYGIGGGDVIAVVWSADGEDESERANARLIAAAPEMLEALKKRDFEMNYIISQLLSCVERAEGLADGGPITREAEKHVHAWRQRLSEIADDAIARAEGRDE